MLSLVLKSRYLSFLPAFLPLTGFVAILMISLLKKIILARDDPCMMSQIKIRAELWFRTLILVDKALPISPMHQKPPW